MGQIRDPLPVLPIFAIFSRYAAALRWVTARLERDVGPIVAESQPFAFDDTGYYTHDMGSDLQKQFVACHPLRDPAELPMWKHRANAWEDEFAACAECPQARPLNVDPGYVTEAKLVLASSKNHAHRIYVGQGIFAEITLAYTRGTAETRPGWQPLAWTYPDYQRSETLEFFETCRDSLRQQLALRTNLGGGDGAPLD